MILFLTNNFKIVKPLYIWLKTKNEVVLYDKKLSIKYLKKLNPDLIISYNYKYIIKKEIIQNYKIINLHISYLPFNRGANPNIWSFLDNTPKGVTIHYIDEGIDTGKIITQKKVVLNQNMTLKTSYKKLHKHIQRLFKLKFNEIKKPKYLKTQKQGTIHYLKDKFVLPKGYNTTIKELIDANRKT